MITSVLWRHEPPLLVRTGAAGAECHDCPIGSLTARIETFAVRTIDYLIISTARRGNRPLLVRAGTRSPLCNGRAVSRVIDTVETYAPSDTRQRVETVCERDGPALIIAAAIGPLRDICAVGSRAEVV